MPVDTTKYKSRIKDYLAARGIATNMDGGTLRCQCPEPSHADNNPTAVVYDETIHCPVCTATWDIFEVAGMVEGLQSFPDKIKAVQSALGEAPQAKKEGGENMIVIPYAQAKDTFTVERLLSLSAYVGKGDPKQGYGDKITGAWPFRTESGDVEIVDVRFEGGPRKKNVISFYWNGKSIKSRNCPVRIYGRERLSEYPDHKVLIVEGCKAAKAAEALIPFGYIPVTWNGGTGKAGKAPWSLLSGREVVGMPDDDQQLDKKTGELLHPSKQPGIKAMLAIKKRIPELKIVEPFPAVREIKADGADIVEYLEMYEPEELAKLLNSHGNYNPGTPKPKMVEVSMYKPPASGPTDTDIGASDDPFSFKILGTANDGKCYFRDRAGRLYDFKLDSTSKGKLLQLAPLSFWCSYLSCSKMGQDEWTQAQDALMEVGGKIDFDTDQIRGRGAWRGDNGKVCYHDGKTTYGEPSEELVFLNKKVQPIGIGSGRLSPQELNKMKEAAFSLSFETNGDAMRLLSWSILAPFSGALSWRPQAFLTGPSGGGKSSVELFIVKPLALPDRFNAGKTSAAGYMQSRRKDAGGVVMDEADPDTETKKKYKEDLLSIMRQSTSDDTPKSAMGTADQTGVTYMTRDMFLFIAISPEIESVADDNRLVKINIKKPAQNGKSWDELKKALTTAMSPENCRKVRNMTWEALPKIIELADHMAHMIQTHTGKDHRFAISEGTLMAAYLTVWKGLTDPTEEQLQEFIAGNYDLRTPEESRDEAVEFIDRLLEHKVKVFVNERSKEFNVLEACKIMSLETIDHGDETGPEHLTKAQVTEFKRALNMSGISVDPDGNLAIANNHYEIKRIAGKQNGYKKILWRHPDLVDKGKNVVFTDKTWRCTAIAGIIQDTVPF